MNKITIDFNDDVKKTFSMALFDQYTGWFGLTLDEFINMCKYEYMYLLGVDYEDGEIEDKENSGELSFEYDKEEFVKIYEDTYSSLNWKEK